MVAVRTPGNLWCRDIESPEWTWSWYRVPLERRGGDEGRAAERVGRMLCRSGESLTDVAEGCVLRVVENKERRRRGGCGERERDRLLTSTLQYTSVLPKRESTPWLTSRESERERRGVCPPTSNWVSTLLSLISAANCPDGHYKPNYRCFLNKIRWWGLLCRKPFNSAVVIWSESLRNVSWCMCQNGGTAEFSSTFGAFLEQIWCASKLLTLSADISVGKKKKSLSCTKAENGILVQLCGQRSRGGEAVGILAGVLCRWGGRSAFGTARLPVWGQLNTAWD